MATVFLRFAALADVLMVTTRFAFVAVVAFVVIIQQSSRSRQPTLADDRIADVWLRPRHQVAVAADAFAGRVVLKRQPSHGPLGLRSSHRQHLNDSFASR